MSEIVSSRRGMGSHAVRWYILVLPVGHRGDPARALRMEASRSVKRDEAMLEYFAPKYIEVIRAYGTTLALQLCVHSFYGSRDLPKAAKYPACL
mgnify:CR=1 FL=1